MVDMRVRPDMCQHCKIERAALIYRWADGTEEWIGWECSKALAKPYNLNDNDATKGTTDGSASS